MPADLSRFIGTSGSSRGANLSAFIKKSPKKVDPAEELMQVAERAGLGDKAQEILKPKRRLSFLQRLGAGLGAFETGNAVYTGMEKGALQGAKSYGTGIFKGLASALTGRDYGQTEKKTYRDIVEKAGIQNGIAKFGLGLLGDILLDPSTYLGGAMVKGALKGTRIGTKGALHAVGKVAPKVEDGLKLAGQGIQEAAGKAFVFGYGTSKGLPERALEVTSKVAKAKEGIVKSNIDRLGTGTLAPSQQEELVSKLLTGKRAEYAARVAGKTDDAVKYGSSQATSASQDANELYRSITRVDDEAKRFARTGDPLDDVVSETMEKQVARSQKFAKQAGIEDPYAIYFPGIRKDKLTKFFEGTKTLRVGSENYTKQFKNLLKDDDMIRNPAEAFAKREFDIAKDNIVRSELRKMVNDFGVPAKTFKNADDALKAGYVAIQEKGQFGKIVGYLNQTDKKFLDDLITPEFTTIDLIAKRTGFDAITSLFKRSVTGLFAPFHVRNYVSGLVQNYEVMGPKVLNPKNITMGQRIAYKLARGQGFGDETLEIAGGKVSLNKITKAFETRFGNSSQYIADIADATRGAGNIPGKVWSKASLKTTLKTAGLGQQSIPFRGARAIGNYIETQQKATVYVTALRDGKNVQEALELAARAGFDYRALTGFESKVLRRIIPFYSFTRKNIELQLRTLGENPQRINNVIKLLRNFSEIGGEISLEERLGLPDYLQEQFAVKTGIGPTGLPEFAAGFQTPIEQPGQILGSNPLRRLFTSVNPFLKAPIERAVNMDFFRNRKLTDVVEAGEYAKAPQIVKDWLEVREVEKKNKDGSTRIAYTADPLKLHLLRNLPSSRGISYLGAIFSDEPTSSSKWLSSTTGFKPRPIDIETVEYFRNRDKQRELEDLLIRAGVLKRFENTYEPKN